MPRIANLHEGKQEARQAQVGLIWQRLTEYANGDGSEKDFKELARECFDRMGVADAPNVLEECKDAQKATIAALYERYREPIQKLLQWLIAPNAFTLSTMDDLMENSMRLSMEVADFLDKHARAYRVEYNIMVEIDQESGSGGSSVLLGRTFSNIGSVVTGICRFILEQVDRHDLHGEPISAVFPFGLCERLGCGRFFIVQRVGRARFCSDNCRSLVGKQKVSKEDKAAYMKQYRAEKARQQELAAKKARKSGRK